MYLLRPVLSVMICHSVYFCLYLSEYSLQYRPGNASRRISNSYTLLHLWETGIFFEVAQLANQKWSSDYLNVEKQPAAHPWFILDIFYTLFLKKNRYGIKFRILLFWKRWAIDLHVVVVVCMCCISNIKTGLMSHWSKIPWCIISCDSIGYYVNFDVFKSKWVLCIYCTHSWHFPFLSLA